MRTAIVGGFDYEHMYHFVEQLIDEYQLDKVYWLTSFLLPYPEEIKDKVMIIDIAYLNFLKDIDQNDLVPIDEPLIDAMKNAESHVAAMNARPYYYHLDYAMTRKRYLRAMRYWNHLLTQENVQFVLFDTLPHSPFDYPIYELAKLRDVPFIFLDNMRPGFTTIWDNWQEHPLGLKEQFEKVKAEASEEVDMDVEELSPRAARIWKKQLGIDDEDANPFYMKKEFWQEVKRKRKKMHQDRLKAKFKDGHITFRKYFSWRGLYNYSRLFAHKHIIKRIKDRLMKARLKELTIDQIPEGKRFFYVAMHMQPEVSSGPRAGAYMDQFLIVEMLSHIVPDDVLILVKENPIQDGLYRDADYYDDMARLRNVFLVSKATSTFDLIANSEAVVTCTGTVGWEALFRSKPTMVFGHSFYGHAKGVFEVKTEAECRAAVEAVLNGEHIPTLEDTYLFLKALDQNAVHANISDIRQAHFYYGPEETIENILKGIRPYLAEVAVQQL